MDENPLFRIAADFVNNTSRNIFLTGKAGTGKTTFLKYIREHTPKKSVVVAPTGVAAINAGGVTMHSFFQLPFGPFIPVSHKLTGESATDQYTLFKNIRVNENKRELLRDLELLIIDEISMVRADMLDATDAILRYFRRVPNKPFGGVQVLFIGDLFQLPPVMPDSDWMMLQDYYQSPFFFHAKVVQQAPPVYIELKKIYRQNEQAFIDILNRIRNDEAEARDFDVLNARMDEAPVHSKKYVTLTTHNYRADKINAAELASLPGECIEFKGIVEGDFPEKNLPTEPLLKLKEGAQVMFIRNDKGEERRFYNGKLATVTEIDGETIKVLLDGSGEELTLERETWNNVRYNFDREEESIQEEMIGTFTQFPIRLAWAITIHKSQGLTFEHAIIDAGDSFAPGQVYVALSRCTSLKGLILRSPITPSSISTDPLVLEYAKQVSSDSALNELLEAERTAFRHEQLMMTFDLGKTVDALSMYVGYLAGKRIPDPVGAINNARRMLGRITELQDVAQRFKHQLQTLLREDDAEKIKDRVSKAIPYFADALKEDVLASLDGHLATLKGATHVRQYVRYVRQLRNSIARKINAIQTVRYGDVVFNPSAIDVPVVRHTKTARGSKGAAKGSSLQETLAMLKNGMLAAEIAEKRGLALSTIEGHVVQLIRRGEVDIAQCMETWKVNEILAVIRAQDADKATSVKAVVGEAFTYNEIRAVLGHYQAMLQREE